MPSRSGRCANPAAKPTGRQQGYVRLLIRDYELPGDSLAITLDASTNRLQGIDVATYLGSPSRPVTMKTTMGTLQDGTTYTAGTALSLPAEQLTVDVSNSGYRKM